MGITATSLLRSCCCRPVRMQGGRTVSIELHWRYGYSPEMALQLEQLLQKWSG